MTKEKFEFNLKMIFLDDVNEQKELENKILSMKEKGEEFTKYIEKFKQKGKTNEYLFHDLISTAKEFLAEIAYLEVRIHDNTVLVSKKEIVCPNCEQKFLIEKDEIKNKFFTVNNEVYCTKCQKDIIKKEFNF